MDEENDPDPHTLENNMSRLENQLKDMPVDMKKFCSSLQSLFNEAKVSSYTSNKNGFKDESEHEGSSSLDHIRKRETPEYSQGTCSVSTFDPNSQTPSNTCHDSNSMQSNCKNACTTPSSLNSTHNVQNDGSHNPEIAEKFKKIREETRKDAIVYLGAYLPIVKEFLLSVRYCLEQYKFLSFEEWNSILPHIVKEIKKNKDVAKTVLKIHEDISIALNERKKMDEEVLQLLEESKRSESTSSNSKFLSLISRTKEFFAKTLAVAKNEEIQSKAASIVKKKLIPALSKFMDSMKDITNFFKILDKDLEDNTNPENHYKVIKSKCDSIIWQLKMFDASLPAIRSTINSIPNDESGVNYVNEWLDMKLTEIEQEEMHHSAISFFKNMRDICFNKNK